MGKNTVSEQLADIDPVEALRARRRVPSCSEMLAAIAERDARREVLAIAERLACLAGDRAVAEDLAEHLAVRAAAPRCGDLVSVPRRNDRGEVVYTGQPRTCRASCPGCGGYDVLQAHDRPSRRDLHVYETAARDEYAFVASLPLDDARRRAAP